MDTSARLRHRGWSADFQQARPLRFLVVARGKRRQALASSPLYMLLMAISIAPAVSSNGSSTPWGGPSSVVHARSATVAETGQSNQVYREVPLQGLQSVGHRIREESDQVSGQTRGNSALWEDQVRRHRDEVSERKLRRRYRGARRRSRRWEPKSIPSTPTHDAEVNKGDERNSTGARGSDVGVYYKGTAVEAHDSRGEETVHIEPGSALPQLKSCELPPCSLDDKADGDDAGHVFPPLGSGIDIGKDKFDPTARPVTLMNATCGEILKWMPPRSSPAVIVQVVSPDFVLVEKNFIIFMEKNSVATRENIYLICVDDTAALAFEILSVRCLRTIDVKTHRGIYAMRVKVLRCLLEAGFDVLLSDSDALWLKDPFEDIADTSMTRYDMITQRGSFPTALGRKWGTTMCMGFAFFRGGTAGMHDFQLLFESELGRNGDDQVSVNQVANNLGVVWDVQSDMRYYKSTMMATGSIERLSGNFTLGLLPHKRYTRDCDRTRITDETVVAHCLTTKVAQDKLKWMRSLHLWLVDTERLGARPPARL